jgi:hypothetical protein
MLSIICAFAGSNTDHVSTVREKDRVVGSKSSASWTGFPLDPPVSNTWPLLSQAAACSYLNWVITPVAVKVPVAGLNSSAVEREGVEKHEAFRGSSSAFFEPCDSGRIKSASEITLFKAGEFGSIRCDVPR